MNSSTALVIFQPSGRRGRVPKGITIVEASRRLGADLENLCGEQHVCGKCTVRIEEGSFEKFSIRSSPSNVSAWQASEEKFIGRVQREQGFRLGCAARIEGDILVYVPEEFRAGKQVVSKAARDIRIEHKPAVRCYTVEVKPPSLEDPTADFERICRRLEHDHGLQELRADIFVLRRLPGALREGSWTVTVSVWNDREIIRVRPGRRAHAYGMAIDVGTTTVAAYVCDLSTMAVIDTVSMMNPQCKYGEDVMARISYHMNTADGLERMSGDIIAAVNGLIDRAVAATGQPGALNRSGTGPDGGRDVHEEDGARSGLSREDIEDIAICFNTVVHHIFLSLNPSYVGQVPFPPVIHHSLDIKARDLGIRINPSSYLYVLPIEAGFVGADNVGVLIAEEPYKHDENQLIIDIGTNGELVLGNRHKLLAASCATGPALEGAQVSFGMRAAPGAIERVVIDPETREVDYKVIGRVAWRKFSEPSDMKVKGICGSGILDLLAELYRSGVILKSGVFNKKDLQDHPRYRANPDTGQFEFVLAWAEESSVAKDIVVTQQDVRQIQLAKGALYAGCKILIKRLGLEKIDKVKIAGAFGTHVDRTKALVMGLLPDCEIDIIESVGNAAGDGCRAALLNTDKRAEAEWCSRNVEYVELALDENFQKEFMEALQLPHMTDEFPHLEGIVADEILKQK